VFIKSPTVEEREVRRAWSRGEWASTIAQSEGGGNKFVAWYIAFLTEGRRRWETSTTSEYPTACGTELIQIRLELFLSIENGRCRRACD
jgi:hypothetical protein